MKYIIYAVLLFISTPIIAQQTVSISSNKNIIIFNNIEVASIIDSVLNIEGSYKTSGTVEIDLSSNSIFVRYKSSSNVNTLAMAISTLKNTPQGLVIYGRDVDYNEISLTITVDKIVLATNRSSKIEALIFTIK